MTEPTPVPTWNLKVGAAAAQWVLGVLAFAWVVLALVWGGLHFVIVPRIAEFRPMLEQQASRALGLTVQIGVISAKSNGLIPSVELNDVMLSEPQGRKVLRLPKVLLAFSARSVLSRGFEQLYIDSPALDIRRTADGLIWIAGVPLPRTQGTDSAAVDWLFSQTEVALVNGSVTWTDELRGATPLTLNAVNLRLENRLFTHALRVDASPPADWGERFSLTGIFKQPVLSRHAGDWQSWKGQIYASFPRVDVEQLRRHADFGVNVTHGAGALRAWVDVERGQWVAATADVALRGVQAPLDAKLEALAFKSISGRIGGKLLAGGFEFSTQGLEFDTHDGLHWPGGNVRAAVFSATGHPPTRVDITADRLDLAALAQIASRLPLGDDAHAAMRRLSPSGLVEQLQGSWNGTDQAAPQFAAKGRVTKLAIPASIQLQSQTLGFQGLDMDFDVNQAGGRASIAMRDGVVDAVGWLDDRLIAVDQLNGDVQWKLEGGNVSVEVPKLRFSNADAQGEVQAKWQTVQKLFPGTLDLQATLSRVSANRVHRYLPSEMDKEVRDYLRDAVLAGTASNVKFKVKGQLDDFPFADSKKGEFRVSGTMHNASYAFAPSSIVPKGSLPWPALNQLSGELVIDQGSLQVKGARAVLTGSPGLQVTKADALIRNLYGDATLVVNAEAKGALADGLALVNGSPLNDITDKVLARAKATGMADYRLKLGFPIAAVERATVQGSVTLANNDLQISPETPYLSRARGVVAYTESGFTVTGGQARALGGDMKIEGGLSVLRTAPTVLRVQGVATADGLRQAKELGLVARLGAHATGAAAYTAVIGLRSGVSELLIQTTLAGMALDLPAPFTKTAAATLPLRYETSAVRSSLLADAAGVVHPQDQLQLDVGRLANIAYVRDVSGADAKVLRGAIGVGLVDEESAPMPESGVVANIRMDDVDLDGWYKVLSNASGADLSAINVGAANPVAGMAYLPTSMAVRANSLVFDGRKLSKVVMGGGREGLQWRANVDATELSGYVEYRQPSGSNAGRLYARLARLMIEQSAAQDVENLLDEQPASIPALDVVVEDFELRGKHLGRVEIDAVNMGAGAARESAREWRMNRFNIITPEAVLTANGNWANITTMTAPTATRSIKDRRRTVMNFKLDITDSGALLNRFGMVGVVRNGRGKIEGQVAWLGSPITLDYPSLGGNFNVNVEVGQFLKADPGIAKLLGVLSLQSLPRRLVLDFRDVFSDGFAFDFFRGDVVIEQGMARTANLQMKGVNAAVLMEGQADIAKETQALRVVVIPEINAGSASLIASVLNPIVGLSTFLAQVILRRPLIDAATQEFFVDGTWLEPRVTKVERSPPQ